ncbi:hypothetical protein MMC20_003107 [Loxospora ochrophaea]|nr:hypothetical protein [Loxospora ochrophaea]
MASTNSIPLSSPPPPSILIVGAGVFGLSTALELLSRPRYFHTNITIVSSYFPFPTELSSPKTHPTSQQPTPASIDTSRIIRADYASPAYSALAEAAQRLWRQGWGGEGSYKESGLVLTYDTDDSGKGAKYVRETLANVRKNLSTSSAPLNPSKPTIQELHNPSEIQRILGVGELPTPNPNPTTNAGGYVNWASGWADAEAAIHHIARRITALGADRFTSGGGTLTLIHDTVTALLFTPTTTPPTVAGIHLSSRSTPLLSPLTILCTGAHTASFLPTSLPPHLTATGQILAHLQLTPTEHASLRSMPVIINMSTGLFIIPPTSSGLLKVARHAYGYRNPTTVSSNPEPTTPSSETTTTTLSISLPAPPSPIPDAAISTLRSALSTLLPSFPSLSLTTTTTPTRSFASSRVCWYADTPTGDFLVTWHPAFAQTLFIATGGSGHAFKFFPVLGGKVVDALEGGLEGALEGLWRWRGEREREGVRGGEGRGVWEADTEDGSRGGTKGMVWGEEEEMRGEGKGRGRERGSRL